MKPYIRFVIILQDVLIFIDEVWQFHFLQGDAVFLSHGAGDSMENLTFLHSYNLTLRIFMYADFRIGKYLYIYNNIVSILSFFCACRKCLM